MKKRNITDLILGQPKPRDSKRTATYSRLDPLQITDSETEAVVRHAWDHVCTILKQEGVSMEWMTEGLQKNVIFGGVQPEGRAPLEKMINGMTMIVSDEELKSVFNLREVDEGSAPLQVDLFYVRSFHLTVGELRTMMGSWTLDGLDYEELVVWLRSMKLLGADDKVFIRYIGTTSGGRTGYSRYLQDLQQREKGVLSAFSRLLARDYPDVLERSHVYEFLDLSYTKPHATLLMQQQHVDTRERILIALFHKPSLLNRQSGGYYLSYELSPQDELLFLQGQTDLFAGFERSASNPPPELYDRILLWCENLRQRINSNPTGFRVDRFPLTEDWFDMVHQQAIPRQVCRLITKEEVEQSRRAKGKGRAITQSDESIAKLYTLFTVVGKDITLESLLASEPFLGKINPRKPPTSRAGIVVATALRNLGKIEAGFGQAVAAGAPFPGGSPDGMFPFINIWPCVGHDDEDDMVEETREYISIVRPLIVVGMSQRVCSSIAANYLHLYGLPRNRFIDFIGVPRIQFHDVSWADDPEKAGPHPESAFILVPHFDPGRDKYGDQSEPLRRLFHLSWMITVLLGYRLMQTLPIPDEIPRQVWLESMLSSIMSAPEMISLQDNLAKCKTDLDNEWQKAHRKLGISLPDASAEKIRQGALRRIARVGLAEGEIGSEERRIQTEMLWRLNIPDLHIKPGLSHQDSEKAAWFAWASGVDKGRSYVMSMLATSPHQTLEDFRRKTEFKLLMSKRQLVSDEVFGLFQQLEDSAKQAETRRIQNGKTSLVQRLHMLVQRYGASEQKLRDLLPTSNLNGKRVYIWGNLQVKVYWKAPDGRAKTFILRAPKTIRDLTPAPEFYLFFNSEGISLYTNPSGTGDPFLINQRSRTVTWDKSTLANYKDFVIIRECWEHHIGLPWKENLAPVEESPSDDTNPILPPEFFAGDARSFPPLSSKPGKSTLAKYSKPPNPYEGTWIVYKFFDEKYPGQGAAEELFMCAQLGAFEGEEHAPKHRAYFRTRLLEFLREPRFRNYPHFDAWQTLLVGETPTGSKRIVHNLKFCRAITSVSAQTRDRATKKMVSGYWLKFGAEWVWEGATEAGGSENV